MINIQFGIIAEKLEIQLKAQKIDYNKNKVRILQKDMDAVDRLYWNNLITESQRDKLRDKIFTRIKKAIIRKVNKPVSDQFQKGK